MGELTEKMGNGKGRGRQGEGEGRTSRGGDGRIKEKVGEGEGVVCIHLPDPPVGVTVMSLMFSALKLAVELLHIILLSFKVKFCTCPYC